MKLTLTIDDYKKWEETERVLYASTSVDKGNKTHLLRFYVYLSDKEGRFNVELKGKEIYRGNNIAEAIQVFNSQS